MSKISITVRLEEEDYYKLLNYSKDLSDETGVNFNVSDLVRESVNRFVRKRHRIKAQLLKELGIE